MIKTTVANISLSARRWAVVFVACAICVAATQARADFTPIAQPDAAYLAATTLIPITAVDEELVTSLTDGFQTITIDPTYAETVPTTWAVWNEPPDSETATPRVLFTGGGIGLVTINLAVPSRIFGIEVEGNAHGVSPEIFATFYRNGSEVGVIGMPVDGSGGSRLFAASTTTSFFNSVTVAIDYFVDDSGFGMAQFRYGDTIPEPATLVLGSLGLLGSIGSVRRRRA